MCYPQQGIPAPSGEAATPSSPSLGLLPNLTGQYNTALSPDDERSYKAWEASQSEKTGRDISKDNFDYDMRGAWKSGVTQSDNGHFPDTFKKPNHPTFSTESQYNSGDRPGGAWLKDDKGKDVFVPGPMNDRYWTPVELERYFKRVEPDGRIERKPKK